MKSAGQGRSKSMKLIVAMTCLFGGVSAFAGSLTVRDIQVKNNQIEIQLDGVTPKGAIDLDYVRDIVQFSIPNATIYPAKILHADQQAFSKVFAYQYAPNLVRVRFSVDGKADAFRGKVKYSQKGKILTISFPSADSLPSEVASDAKEQSLISKVLNSGKKEEAKVEAIKPVESKSEKAEAKSSKKLTGNLNDNDESRPRKTLGGANTGPSSFRTFLAMFLVVGGLGVVLIYVKKKKNSGQAKRIGDSWLAGILPGAKKQKSFIEVVAQHPLGPKHSITVVKIKGQQFVLAVTPENVQVITQLDSDEDIDVMDDPAIAATIGKMFGGKPTIQTVSVKDKNDQPVAVAPQVNLGSSFDSILKGSNGAGAIVARNAYAAQNSNAFSNVAIAAQQNLMQNASSNHGVRDQIRKRLEGMKNA
jgi:flagellar biogenesis protein FliO